MNNVQLRVGDLLYAAFKRWKMILALGLLGFICGFALSGVSYLQGNYTSYEISSKGKDLQTKMTEMLSKDEVSPEDMMALQFEVGQYNAMLESLSSVTKSMTDMMKSLAQRTG